MKRFIFIPILFGFCINFASAQDSIVAIPNKALLNTLLQMGVDINGDSLISHREAETVDSLNVAGWYFTDLTGIETLVNLVYLDCRNNEITSLDISRNTNLKELYCDNIYSLGVLDVSNNPYLEVLRCRDCGLFSLDVSNNPALKELDCSWNLISSLDLSNNAALETLTCESNLIKYMDVSANALLSEIDFSHGNLISIDISGNSNLKSLNISYMPSLIRACVYETPFPYPGIDVRAEDSPNVYYTADCTVNPDEQAYIPDAAFLQILLDMGTDTDGDRFISFVEAREVTKLNLTNKGIYDLTGLEAFENLEELYVSGNHLTSLNVSQNLALTHLKCNSNLIANLDVSNNSGLVYLDCAWNQITSLDVSDNPGISFLNCAKNQITSLNISNADLLAHLDCSQNQITSLDVSGNTSLTHLECAENLISNLNTTNISALNYLSCYANQLTGLDVSSNTTLGFLYCSSNHLSSLDLSNNTYLRYLDCGQNELKSLELTANSALTGLGCEENQISSLEISNMTALSALQCGNNQISSLDLSRNRQLRYLDIQNMSALGQVCVWATPFPRPGVTLFNSQSPNAYFTDECSEATIVEAIENLVTSIYPNPAHSILTIETASPDRMNIKINALNGSLLMSQISNGPTHQVDISTLDKGVYFITVSTNELITTEKIVKW